MGLLSIAGTLLTTAVTALVMHAMLPFLGESLFNDGKPKHQVSAVTMSWVAYGGLSIALALSVPAAFGHSGILPTTYLVVVFSVIVQGGTLDLFLKRADLFS